ncbi:MAG: SDR family oxidoreductase [Bacteroidota bacterium]
MNNSYFENKVVAVTGGSEGIGRAVVEALLAINCKVATCGRNSDKLYQLQVANPNKPLHTKVADVSNQTDCRRFIESTIETFGGIDILINNAGISMKAVFEETDLDTIRKVMDVNFWGAVYCTKYALDTIVENKGDIVGISAIAGNRGLPGRSGYSASKWAMQGWLEALRTELLDTGVNVIWVSPWFTHSYGSTVSQGKLPPNNESESPINETGMISVEDCAEKILNAVAKRKRAPVLTLRGKFTVLLCKLFPRLADQLVRKFFYTNGTLTR